MLPQQLAVSSVPICAGLFGSLVNSYVVSNSKLDACCATIETEKLDSESDDSMKTVLFDTLSKASGTTAATLPIPPRIHTAHHIITTRFIDLF